MLFTTFILLIIYQFKHFLADFPLQNTYMLGKFKESRWILPLASHAGVHATFTLVIAYFFTESLNIILFVTALDFVIHFIMDRIKASPNLLGRWKPDQAMFWNALGIDQMVHHLTHYIIIFILVIF